MFQSWINGVLGIWMIVAGFISTVQHSVNYIIVGIIVAALGFWAAKRWQNTVSGVLGLWLIVSGIITTLIAPVNSIIIGIVIAVLSFWAATMKRGEMVQKTA